MVFDLLAMKPSVLDSVSVATDEIQPFVRSALPPPGLEMIFDSSEPSAVDSEGVTSDEGQHVVRYALPSIGSDRHPDKCKPCIFVSRLRVNYWCLFLGRRA